MFQVTLTQPGDFFQQTTQHGGHRHSDIGTIIFFVQSFIFSMSLPDVRYMFQQMYEFFAG